MEMVGTLLYLLLDNRISLISLLYDGASDSAHIREVSTMFLILAIVLFVLWIGGFLVFKTAGVLIHLLLIFAIISLIMNFVSGKKAV
jgi:hypothetical protein